jgi:hypothetical protein
MGVYEGRGLLSKSLKQLQLRWQEAKGEWNDVASQHFEKKYLQPLEADLRTATTAMDHLAAVLVQVRRDCQ